MIVLPGAMYLNWALQAHFLKTQVRPLVLGQVRFARPVLISEKDTEIGVEAVTQPEGGVEYSFFEIGTGKSSQQQPFAQIIFPGVPANQCDMGLAGIALDAPGRSSSRLMKSEELYARLRENGNQYGPSFQGLDFVSVGEDWVFGRLSIGSTKLSRETQPLDPILFDSMVQTLAALALEQCRTFVLQSISSVHIYEYALPDGLSVQAKRLPGAAINKSEIVGDIRLLDEKGKVYLELQGVRAALLERVEDLTVDRAGTPVCVASNFTADLLREPLEFWADYFERPLRIAFAPYNQVFQQLLDPSSALAGNRQGMNILVLGLEEWLHPSARETLRASSKRASHWFANRDRRVLPNGLEVLELNRHETDYVYHEIFEDRCYLRHGIRLEEGATVVDVGANIGLFSLFVLSHCEGARVFAYEPSPVVFELLRANGQVHGPGQIETFNLGVADRAKTATFTFYEKSSVFSGFYPDQKEDDHAIRAVVRNILNNEIRETGASVENYVQELSEQRLQSRTCSCELVSVADIIRANRLERIHLLKIDAEKSELDILKGIRDEDWPIIDQIVIEIHDTSGAVAREIQCLLTSRGFRCTLDRETLLDGSGLFNLYGTRPTERKRATEPAALSCILEPSIEEFCAALSAFAAHNPNPLVAAIAPRTPDVGRNARLNQRLQEEEELLLERASQISSVSTISSQSIAPRASAWQYYDAHSQEQGHVPYTKAGHIAVGTSLYRSIFRLSQPPFKVIVLDCDNTLWQGVCGEDGPQGVVISKHHQQLQECMVRQLRSGRLICLCSKNRPEDVWAVFEARPEMALRREHLATVQLNWRSKSENLRVISDELGLGLESFVFVDDNPVECAEVRVNCPEVLTLQLPLAAERFGAFLERAWVLDLARQTSADSSRTEWYLQNDKRERFRRQETTLESFLRGLELRMEVRDATPEQWSRIAQLTLRTNQFNFTGHRRSEAEIRHWIEQEGGRCLVSTASDRFGDYGLVGVVLYQATPTSYQVDTFLLSCRALGKGIEHHMLAALGQRAHADGRDTIEIPFVPTVRNEPAREFLRQFGQGIPVDADQTLRFQLSTSEVMELRYVPNATLASKDSSTGAPAPDSRVYSRPSGGSRTSLSTRIQTIADELYDPGRIAAAIENQHLRHRPASAARPAAVFGNLLEAQVAQIWARILGLPGVGPEENFFDLGGSSLKAVLVVAAIKKELEREVSIVHLFEFPTVRLLAAKLQSGSGATLEQSINQGALARGRQRRQVIHRRKT